MLTYQAPPLNETEKNLARQARQRLAHQIAQNQPLRVKTVGQSQEEVIELPAPVVELLMKILEAMAAGKGITVVPLNAELTTVQAADLLSVSRPFLIKLLENGAIPYHKVGTHRRVFMSDLLQYKERILQEQHKILDELVADAQAQGMGYELE